MNACVRAAAEGKMRAVRYDGFWAPMDTLKERAQLEDLHRRRVSPWALWDKRLPEPKGSVPALELPDVSGS